jgi:hypothetical protein
MKPSGLGADTPWPEGAYLPIVIDKELPDLFWLDCGDVAELLCGYRVPEAKFLKVSP